MGAPLILETDFEIDWQADADDRRVYGVVIRDRTVDPRPDEEFGPTSAPDVFVHLARQGWRTDADFLEALCQFSRIEGAGWAVTLRDALAIQLKAEGRDAVETDEATLIAIRDAMVRRPDLVGCHVGFDTSKRLVLTALDRSVAPDNWWMVTAEQLVSQAFPDPTEPPEEN